MALGLKKEVQKFFNKASKGDVKDIIIATILILYTFNIQTLFSSILHKEHSNEFLLILTVSILTLYNLYFIERISKYLIKCSPEKNILEYWVIVLIGLLNVLLFAGVYFSFGIEVGIDPNSNEPIISTGSYINSIYFSLVTWTTLGYGDFKPTESLRLIAAIQAFLGYIYMALLVGIFLNAFNHRK